MKPNLATLMTLSIVLLIAACAQQPEAPAPDLSADTASTLPRIIQADPQETHFGELRMLTDGGENAEAYFSFAGDKLIMQSTRSPYGCDQIFVLDTETAETTLASTGTGRTTCAYYLPDDEWIVYGSTHEGSPDCPPVPDHSQGYVWPIYPSYDIYRARPDGSEVSRLTNSPGYDAEATVSPAGDRIVFTSTRDGDLDIYSMKNDGSDVVRLTDSIGYDGGPFYSPDGTKIVYRTRHPSDPAEIEDYQRLLADGLVRPSKLEIWVMDADGSKSPPLRPSSTPRARRSSSRPTTATPRAASLTSGWSTSTARISNRSPSPKASTVSRCGRRTARPSSSAPTGITRSRARRMSS
jgi:Tol biopolymer transport system component